MHTYAHRGMEPKETFIPLGWSSCLYITMYCIFGVSTFKGLLSIPSHGRGARRPLGQSFHESVGPTPAWIFRQSRGERGLRLSISLYKDGEPTLVSQIVENLSRAVRPQTRVVAVTWLHSCTGV